MALFSDGGGKAGSLLTIRCYPIAARIALIRSIPGVAITHEAVGARSAVELFTDLTAEGEHQWDYQLAFAEEIAGKLDTGELSAQQAEELMSSFIPTDCLITATVDNWVRLTALWSMKYPADHTLHRIQSLLGSLGMPQTLQIGSWHIPWVNCREREVGSTELHMGLQRACYQLDSTPESLRAQFDYSAFFHIRRLVREAGSDRVVWEPLFNNFVPRD